MKQKETAWSSSPTVWAPSERTVLARGALPSALEGRVATVERRASAAGVEVPAVGTAELFAQTRLLVGDRTWVVMPVGRDPTMHRGRLPLTAEQRQRLKALAEAGCHFPAVYSAHEIDPSKASQVPVAPGSTSIDDRLAARLVGAAPPTAQATARSARLGEVTETLGRAAGKVLAVVGAAALAPVLATGALTASLALDPVLFGVVTASGRAVPGEIGAWMIIAQWTW